jgi:hypothetical protein
MDWVRRREYDEDKEKTANAMGPKRAVGRTTVGKTEGMEGMAVGGKSCLSYYCPGGETTTALQVMRSYKSTHIIIILLLLFFFLSVNYLSYYIITASLVLHVGNSSLNPA